MSYNIYDFTAHPVTVTGTDVSFAIEDVEWLEGPLRPTESSR